MADEVTTGQDEAVEAPVDGQPQEETPSSEQVIEVGGRRFKSWEDVGKSYEEAEKRMRAVEQEKLRIEQERQSIQEKYGWADNWQQYLEQNPQKRAEIEQILNDDGTQTQWRPDPTQQEVFEIKKELEGIRINNSISELKARGYNIDEDRERAIREHVFRTGNSDVEAAYKVLFFNDELERIKNETARSTGDALAQSQNAYSVPPTGQAATKGKDVREMSQAEYEAALEKELEKVDPFSDFM